MFSSKLLAARVRVKVSRALKLSKYFLGHSQITHFCAFLVKKIAAVEIEHRKKVNESRASHISRRSLKSSENFLMQDLSSDGFFDVVEMT